LSPFPEDDQNEDGSEMAFLDHLEPDELESLRGRGTRRRYPTGSMLFHEGERSDYVMAVISGRVKISYFTADGKEVVLAVRGAGDLLGELSAIDGETRSATASALEPVDAVVLRAEEFTDFLGSYPRLALLMLRMVSRKLRDADRKRIEFTAHDSIGRVAKRLVELADRYGEPTDDGIVIKLALSQQELAGWTGSSREAVSKALQALRARGWIETRRRQIVVRDLQALTDRSAG
jgi:CRP-like cAMP-binding protein